MKNNILYPMSALVAVAAFGALMMLTACSGSNGKYDASGTFEATEVIVSSEASGKILSFDVQEGQRLAAGQQVGYVDSLQLYYKKMQLVAGQQSVQSSRPDISKQIAATEQQIATAKTEKRRIENLLKANAATQKQLDDQNSMLLVLEKQLEAQKSSLQNTDKSLGDQSAGMKYQIDQLTDQLNKCRIINPINGTLLTKYAEAGEVTTPGKPLYKIADTDNMLLRAYVLNNQLSELKIGQQVRIYADSGDGSKEYEGVVSWISDKAEFTPKTIQTRDERANLVYAVKIAVKNDGFIKIGMYGDMKIK
jgi:HlyD family secretion protein